MKETHAVNTRIEIAILCLALLTLAVFLFGACDKEQDPGQKPERNSKWTSLEFQSIPIQQGLYVLEADGHEWLILRGWKCMGMSHRPSCRYCKGK